MLKAAASQKTLASPVQPSRSSRCGQSVGTPKKFERWLHRLLRHNCWITGLAMRRWPVSARFEETTTPSTSSAVGARPRASARPSTST
jgi:hypothetical protein